jgi:membrane associated rhomboid family serine protease
MAYGFRTYGPPSYSLGGGGRFLTPAIKLLLIASVAVFVVQLTVRLAFGLPAEMILIRWFGLVPYAVTHGLRIWQPFTYLFLHGDLWHILINMFVLWMFGSDLERTWGYRRFLRYFFITGVGAGLMNVLVKSLVDWTGQGPSLIPTIGASGAVYGILAGAALVFPGRQVLIFPFPVMIPMRVYVLVIGAIAFYGSLSGPGDTISHVTHLGGMLVGYFYLRRGTFLYELQNRWLDWRRRRARRKFEVYMRHREEERPPRDPWVN